MRRTLQPLIALVVVAMGPVHAKGLSAVCLQLQGAKVVPGTPATIERETQDGPILLIDAAKPQLFTSIWKSRLFDRETVDKYEGVVLEFSNERMHAVEKDQYGLTSYSLFLPTGQLFYSNLRYSSLLSKEPSLLAFVTTCHITVRP